MSPRRGTRTVSTLIARVQAARVAAGCSLEDVSAVMDTSRFTYFKWEKGELTESVMNRDAQRQLGFLERALVIGRDAMLLPEPRRDKREKILRTLVQAVKLKLM